MISNQSLCSSTSRDKRKDQGRYNESESNSNPNQSDSQSQEQNSNDIQMSHQQSQDQELQNASSANLIISPSIQEAPQKDNKDLKNDQTQNFIGIFLFMIVIVITVAISFAIYRVQTCSIKYDENGYYLLDYTIANTAQTQGQVSSSTYKILLMVTDINGTQTELMGLIQKQLSSSNASVYNGVIQLFLDVLQNETNGDLLNLLEVNQTLPFFRYTVEMPKNSLKQIQYGKSLSNELKTILSNSLLLFSPHAEVQCQNLQGSSRRRRLQQQDWPIYNKTKKLGKTFYKRLNQYGKENSQGLNQIFNETIIIDTSGYFKQASRQLNYNLTSANFNDSKSGTLLHLSDIEANQTVYLIISLEERKNSTKQKMSKISEVGSKSLTSGTIKISNFSNIPEEFQKQDNPYSQQCQSAIKTLNKTTTQFFSCNNQTIPILEFEVLGFNIKVQKYLDIVLKAVKDQKRPLKRTINLQVDVGFNFNFEGSYQKISIQKYSQNFSPQPLNKTLQVANHYYGDKSIQFNEELNKTFNDEFYAHYEGEDNFKDKCDSFISQNQVLYLSITVQEEKLRQSMNTSGVAKEIQQIMEQLQENSKNQSKDKIQYAISFAQLLVSNVSKAYTEALSQFNQSSLSANAQETQSILTSYSLQFMNETATSVDQPLTEMSQEKAIEQYSITVQPMLSTILSMIKYVEEQIQSLNSDLQEIREDHNQSYIHFSQSLLNLFQVNQHNIIQPYNDTIYNRLQEVKQELQQLQKTFQLIDKDSFDDGILSFMTSQLIIFNATQYSTQFTQKINSLQTIINESALSVQFCCKYSCYGLCEVGQDIDYCLTQSNQTCTDNQTQECVQWNYAHYKQIWHQNMLAQFESAYIHNLTEMADSLRNFTTNVNDIINHTIMTIPQKYQRITQEYEAIIVYNLQQIFDNLLSVLNNAVQIHSYSQCQTIIQLSSNQYLPTFYQLTNLTQEFINYYQQLTHNYEQFTTIVDIPLYNISVEYAYISSSIYQFYSQYELRQQIAMNSIQQLQQYYQQYTTLQFIKSENQLQTIYTLHDNIRSKLHYLCYKNETLSQQILQIREQYELMLNNLTNTQQGYMNNTNSSLYYSYMQQLQNFLSNGTIKFTQYLQTQFCDTSTQFREDLIILQQQLQHYQIIIQIYNNFTQLWTQAFRSAYYVDNMDEIRQQLQLAISESQLESVMDRIVGESENYENYMKKVNYNLITMKNSTQQLYLLNLSSDTQVKNSIQHFTEEEFNINITNMFTDIYEEYYNKIQLSSLSTQQLQTYLSYKRVRELYDLTVDDFEEGIQTTINSYQHTINNITHITQNSDGTFNPQLYSYKKEYQKIKDNLHEQIWKNNIQKMKKLNEKVNEKENENELFKKNKGIIGNLSNIAQSKRNSLDNETSTQFEEGLNTLQVLRIQQLNEVYGVTEQIKQTMEQINTTFPSSTDNFTQQAQQDFDKIVNHEQSLADKDQSIKSEYNDKIQPLKVKLLQVQNNSTIVDSSLVDEFNEDIDLNYTQIQEKSKEKRQEVKGNVDNFNPQQKQQFQKYSTIKKQVKMAQQSQQHLTKIDKKYRMVKKEVYKLNKGVFTGDKSQQLKTKLQSALNDSKTEASSIKQKINQINSTADAPSKITTTFSNLKQEKQSLLNQISQFMVQVSSTIDKIKVFFEKTSLNDLNAINEGIIEITSSGDLGSQVQTQTLVNQEHNETVEVQNEWGYKEGHTYQQIIPNMIGYFFFGFKPTLQSSHSILIDYSDYRNIHIQSSLNASLDAQITYADGSYSNEFSGVYMSGRLFDLNSYHSVTIQNGVQLQLVSALKQVTEIKQENKIQAIMNNRSIQFMNDEDLTIQYKRLNQTKGQLTISESEDYSYSNKNLILTEQKDLQITSKQTPEETKAKEKQFDASNEQLMSYDAQG